MLDVDDSLLVPPLWAERWAAELTVVDAMRPVCFG